VCCALSGRLWFTFCCRYCARVSLLEKMEICSEVAAVQMEMASLMQVGGGSEWWLLVRTMREDGRG